MTQQNAALVAQSAAAADLLNQHANKLTSAVASFKVGSLSQDQHLTSPHKGYAYMG